MSILVHICCTCHKHTLRVQRSHYQNNPFMIYMRKTLVSERDKHIEDASCALSLFDECNLAVTKASNGKKIATVSTVKPEETTYLGMKKHFKRKTVFRRTSNWACQRDLRENIGTRTVAAILNVYIRRIRELMCRKSDQEPRTAGGFIRFHDKNHRNRTSPKYKKLMPLSMY